MNPVTSTTPPLTADQLRVAELFAAMSVRSQREVLDYMTVIAAAFPLHPSHVFQLIGGSK